MDSENTRDSHDVGVVLQAKGAVPKVWWAHKKCHVLRKIGHKDNDSPLLLGTHVACCWIRTLSHGPSGTRLPLFRSELTRADLLLIWFSVKHIERAEILICCNIYSFAQCQINRLVWLRLSLQRYAQRLNPR